MRVFKVRSKVSFILFSIAIVLLVLSTVQVECPICSRIPTENTGIAGILKVTDIKWEVIGYDVYFPNCAQETLIVDYLVNILIANEGSNSISMPILIRGTIKLEILEKYGAFVDEEYQYEFIYLEIASNEMKTIQIKPQIWIGGTSVDRASIYGAEFSIVVDPDEIITQCMFCGGDGKILLFEWLDSLFD